MNRIYRLVWCRARGVLVAASELARTPRAAAGDGGGSRASLMLTAIALGLIGILHGSAARAQSVDDTKLADLQALVNKYDPALAPDPLPAAGVRADARAMVSSASARGPLPALRLRAQASTPLADVHAKVRVDRHGVAIRAGLGTRTLTGILPATTHAASDLPVAGRALPVVDGLVEAVAGAAPPVRIHLGATVSPPSTVAPLAADRRRAEASRRGRTLGIAAGGDPAGSLGGVIGGVVDSAAKLPVAGPVGAQVGQVAGSITSGGSNSAGVIGGVVDTAAKLPVAGPVVAQVGQVVGSITSGGSNSAGVIGGVVDSAAKLPVAGPVVAQMGSALRGATSGHLDPGTTLGAVVGGVVNNGATLPALGPTVASVGQSLKTVTSGGSVGGGIEGQAGQVVGGAVNSLSRTPVAGQLVSRVDEVLQETTAQIGGNNGGGSVPGQIPGGVLGPVAQVVDGVADATSNVPVAGPVAAAVGNALDSVAAGKGNVPGSVGQVVDGIAGATSKVPVVSAVAGKVSGVLDSVASDNGNASGAASQLVGDLADVTSNMPAVGPVVGQLGDMLGGTMNQGGAPFATRNQSLAPPDTIAPTGMVPMASMAPMAAPTVPPPGSTPTGLIIGNDGVMGTATQLLGPTESSLFTNSDPNGYISNGSLRVSNANFTQGYSTLNLLGLPVVNSTPVGTVLTTVDGTVLGGTGTNSHLTLIGGVTSGNYISNINNGAAGGTLGLLLPSGAPAWASTCLNAAGLLTESCWAVNAAQDYQVLMGDGASANGSKEVVIGTNASHTLPTEDASQAFPGNGANDPNNPTGVPTADYAARLGHSVVIGDDAAGTANAQTILGAEATASVANSVALGYKSAANRGAQANYSAYGLAAPQNSAGEVSIGAPGAERQITNVAAGSADTDAVNVAQLKAVATTADNAVQYDNTTHALVTLIGPTSTDGGVTGGTTISNLHQGMLSATSTDAVNGSQLWHWSQDTTNVYSNYALYQDIQNIKTGPGNNTGVEYFHVNSAGPDSSATGTDSIAIGPSAKSGGQNSVAMGNGASAAADNSVAIGANSVADRANTVSVGSAGNARQITNVAAGTAATDAVNLGQMSAAVNSSTKGTVRYDTNADGSTNYNDITLGGGSGGDGTVIHNVGMGSAQADAVNVRQLQSGMQQAVDWANAYTDQRIQQMGNQANAGVAAAMASAGLPQAYEPGRSMAAVAAGSFRGESSIAIGVSTISEGGRWVYKLTGSADSRGDAGVSIGAGMQW